MPKEDKTIFGLRNLSDTKAHALLAQSSIPTPLHYRIKMCQHTIYIFSCHHLASGPFIIQPCKSKCCLYYNDSVDPRNDFVFPYRTRSSIVDIVYVDLDASCEECDPLFDPYESSAAGIDEAHACVWHVPAVPVLERDIFRKVGWTGRGKESEARGQDEKSTPAILCNQERRELSDPSEEELVIECISPKSKHPWEA